MVTPPSTRSSTPARDSRPRKLRQPAPGSAWVRLPSGRYLNLFEPTFADLDDTDLAISLSRTFRWGGHSIWPLPMSVAQHSLLVLAIRRERATLDIPAQLRELLHDAEEGLVGFDPISPLKPVLGSEFKQLLEHMQKVLFAKYGVSWWSTAGKAQHKQADILAAASEAIHVAGWSAAEVRDILDIQMPTLADDPLQAVYGGIAWEPWPMDLAAQRYEQELKRLLDML